MSSESIKQISLQIIEFENELEDILKRLEIENNTSNEEEFASKQMLRQREGFVEKQLRKLRSTLRLRIEEKEKNYIIERNGEKKEITLVPTMIVNPIKGLISSRSPLARALRKAIVGDEIKVNSPKGIQEYKVICSF